MGIGFYIRNKLWPLITKASQSWWKVVADFEAKKQQHKAIEVASWPPTILTRPWEGGIANLRCLGFGHADLWCLGPG